jgi:hypothetical protein
VFVLALLLAPAVLLRNRPVALAVSSAVAAIPPVPSLAAPLAGGGLILVVAQTEAGEQAEQRGDGATAGRLGQGPGHGIEAGLIHGQGSRAMAVSRRRHANGWSASAPPLVRTGHERR